MLALAMGAHARLGAGCAWHPAAAAAPGTETGELGGAAGVGGAGAGAVGGERFGAALRAVRVCPPAPPPPLCAAAPSSVSAALLARNSAIVRERRAPRAQQRHRP